MSEQEQAAGPPPVRGKDPLESFRGVLMGALIVEAVTVALAMLLVIKFNGGATSMAGWIVIALVVALLVTCGLLRRTYSLAVGFGLQIVMIACAFFSVPLAIIGGVFAVVWGCLLWMRNDVAKRKAAGLLPAQQPLPEPEPEPEEQVHPESR